MTPTEEAVTAVEEEISRILKPQEAHTRPSMSLVHPSTPEPMNAVLPPSKAQERAILTVAERLSLLESQNAEVRAMITMRCDAIEAMLAEHTGDIERLINGHIVSVEAKLDAILTILG